MDVFRRLFKKRNNVRCNKTIEVGSSAEEMVVCGSVRAAMMNKVQNVVLNWVSCAYTEQNCVYYARLDPQECSILFFCVFNVLNFPLHLIQKCQHFVFDYLKKKKLSLNQCYSMWTAQNYSFSQ